VAIQHIGNDKGIVWEHAHNNRKGVESMFSMQSMPKLLKDTRVAIMD
jgi:hypothetical protein